MDHLPMKNVLMVEMELTKVETNSDRLFAK